MSEPSSESEGPAGSSESAGDAYDGTVAIAHYPEGAGHATRMLAVGKAFEAHGAEITIAGGGPGGRFLEANGYAYEVPTVVNYIEAYQDGGDLRRVLTDSLPRTARRIYDFVRWLRREQPDVLVTDDMFAAVAAPIARTPFYFLTHDAAGFYDERVERTATALWTRYQRRFSEAFFYTTVWGPHPVDPSNVVRIPPVALDAEDASVEGEIDVLLVPSHYSEGFADLAARLAADGNAVTHVGGDDWETVPALLPYMRAASVVVCSGYSTVMEAAVAGTPCVIYPFTDEQWGVARAIEERAGDGFSVAGDVPAVLDAVADPPNSPSYENGADVIARHVLANQ